MMDDQIPIYTAVFYCAYIMGNIMIGNICGLAEFKDNPVFEYFIAFLHHKKRYYLLKLQQFDSIVKIL